MEEFKFIKQGEDSCCKLYALCNSIRHLGRGTPEPGQPEWEELVDLAGCRYGSTINIFKPAEKLGASLSCMACENGGMALPAIVTVENPALGTYLHSTAVVEIDPSKGWKFVGYNTEGPLVEYIDPHEISWPLPHLNYSFKVTLV